TYGVRDILPNVIHTRCSAVFHKPPVNSLLARNLMQPSPHACRRLESGSQWGIFPGAKRGFLG
ncbi:hypothetical protein, partial [Serratia marcescens]|uniref:hypothetical protein n=1 Tax=Serratia marcescens TaxID=615 RepID=UPI002AA0CE7D